MPYVSIISSLAISILVPNNAFLYLGVAERELRNILINYSWWYILNKIYLLAFFTSSTYLLRPLVLNFIMKKVKVICSIINNLLCSQVQEVQIIAPA